MTVQELKLPSEYQQGADMPPPRRLEESWRRGRWWLVWDFASPRPSEFIETRLGFKGRPTKEQMRDTFYLDGALSEAQQQEQSVLNEM